MNNTLSLAIELFVNLFQGALFTYFINTFFTPRFKKGVNTAICISVALLMFASITIINYVYTSFAEIEVLVFLAIMIPFSVFCHKGKIYLKIFLPMVTFAIFMALAIVYTVLITALFNMDVEKVIYVSSVYRYIYLFIFNSTFTFVLFIIRRVFKNRLNLKKPSEIFTCIVIPLLTIFITFLATAIITDEHTSDSARVYLGIITLIAFIIVFSMFFIMRQITRSNELSVINLMMEKEQRMYKSEIDNRNKYIDKISAIKHEIRRKLACIDELIRNENFDEAAKLCRESVEEIDEIAPIYRTDNVYLNFILGITRRKAMDNGVQCKIIVKSNLDGIDGGDLLSLLGNLIDNAFEAMTFNCGEKYLQITAFEKEHYYIISVKNTAKQNVLKSNPQLKSTKADKAAHGHGLKIVRNIVSRYNGNISFSERDNTFVASLMLEKMS